jgi:FAD/FMN-containing dehydrogenase
MTSQTNLEPAVQQLGASFSGPLLTPQDDTYDEARKLHNGMIDKHPALIAQCRTVADITDAVDFAQQHGLEVAVRGGGHNVAGRATLDDGLMIDLSLMKGVYVDPQTRTARSQCGVTWGEFNRETQVHGLATTGGTVSTTGVSGLTLGGGFGWLMAQYGLAADNLLAAEIVTADGKLVTTSDEENADLFWAIRGGGGNFGIAASLKYQLHPVGPMIAGGLLGYPFEQAGDVWRYYRELTASMPIAMGISPAFLTSPGQPGVKLAGLTVAHLGKPEAGAAEVRPIKDFGSPVLDSVGPASYCDVHMMIDEFFPRGKKCYWKSQFISDLSDQAIDVMVEAYADCPSPDTVMLLEYWHGAATAVDSAATAFPHRQEGHNLLVMSQWDDPANGDECIRWTRDLHEAMEPFITTGGYVNYMDHDEGDAVAKAYGSNYPRLQSIKQKYDPENFFHMNQNIRPQL